MHLRGDRNIMKPLPVKGLRWWRAGIRTQDLIKTQVLVIRETDSLESDPF